MMTIKKFKKQLNCRNNFIHILDNQKKTLFLPYFKNKNPMNDNYRHDFRKEFKKKEEKNLPNLFKTISSNNENKLKQEHILRC
ncbi:MAG: hypothetical protein IJG09_06555 [Methanobrevibacter sp.]|nr:hypothetical protein [Methanobrevibacter sp.]